MEEKARRGQKIRLSLAQNELTTKKNYLVLVRHALLVLGFIA
jgi:hypothetical protein